MFMPPTIRDKIKRFRRVWMAAHISKEATTSMLVSKTLCLDHAGYFFEAMLSMLNTMYVQNPDAFADEPLYRNTPQSGDVSGVRNIRYLLMTTDRSLYGDYNDKLIKYIDQSIGSVAHKGGRVVIDVSGKIGYEFVLKKHHNMMGRSYQAIEHTISRTSAEDMVVDYEREFLDREFDEFRVAYISCANHARPEVCSELVLPISLEEINSRGRPHRNGKAPERSAPPRVLYSEPHFDHIVHSLTRSFLVSRLYHIVLESIVSKYRARALTMSCAIGHISNFMRHSGDQARRRARDNAEKAILERARKQKYPLSQRVSSEL